jgi:oxalate---CoA ligase
MSGIPRYRCFKEFFQALKSRSSSIALLAPDRNPLSCRELCRQIEYAVSFLNRHGSGRGNRIGAVLPDGPEMATLFLCCIAGGAFVPLKPDEGERAYDLRISALRLDALIVQADSDSPASAIARRKGIPIIALTPLLEAGAGLFSLEWLSGDSRGACRPGFAHPDDTALVLETSGSTSHPKVVPLSQDTIFVSAHYTGTSLSLTGEDRCLNVMPMCHIAGLVSPLLASLSAGGSVICPAGFSPERFFACLKRYEPTWYSAVPTIHQSIIERAAELSIDLTHTSLRFVRSTSFPLPESVFEKLEDTFGLPVIQTFGLTEALPVTSTPLSPYKRNPLSVGFPVSEVDIVDESGASMGDGIGEIVVKGPQVFKGYENSPEATGSAFIDGWFRTGDLGYLDKEGLLYITGRLKETINRGGQKVSPLEVEAVLMSHPSVREAVAFGIAHPRLGEAVASVVVPKASREITEGELRLYCAERLAPFKVPQHFVLADSIPTGPAGKFNRTDLAEKFVNLLKPDSVPPTTELEIALAKLWQDVLGIEAIGIHDNFFAIGGDSLLGMRLLSLISKHMGVSLPVEAIFRNTLEELAGVIAKNQNRRNNPNELTALLAEIEKLSEEEAGRMLSGKDEDR